MDREEKSLGIFDTQRQAANALLISRRAGYE